MKQNEKKSICLSNYTKSYGLTNQFNKPNKYFSLNKLISKNYVTNNNCKKKKMEILTLTNNHSSLSLKDKKRKLLKLI